MLSVEGASMRVQIGVEHLSCGGTTGTKFTGLCHMGKLSKVEGCVAGLESPCAIAICSNEAFELHPTTYLLRSTSERTCLVHSTTT